MLPSKLLYFMTLARIENYTKAAEELEISQPTLSNNIASLEEEMDVKLFEKSGRSIKLTKSGKVFLKYAEKCVEILDEGKAEVRKLSSEINGNISVAHVNIQSNVILPNYIKEFLDANPTMNIHFDFHIAITDKIIEGIKKDIYDIGFCFKGSNDADIEYLPLWEEEFVIIVPLDHPLSDKESVCFIDTLEYPHITYSSKSLIHDAVAGNYRKLMKSPEVVSTVEATGAMIGLVSKGVGIGFVPTSVVIDKSNVKMVRISDVDTRRMIYMVYDKRKYQSPCVKRCVKHMDENHRLDIKDL